MNEEKHEHFGLIMGLVGMMIFSLSLPGTRYLADLLSPTDIGLGRALIATSGAFMFLLYWRRGWPTLRQGLSLVCASSGIAFGFPMLTAVAMQTVPASHGAVILAALPLVTAISGVMFNRERPSWAFWAVAALGLLLVVAYAWITQGSAADFAFHYGDLALFAAVLLAGLGYGLGAKVAQQLSGGEAICWILVLSFPLQVLWAGFFLDVQAMQALEWQALGVLVFLGLMCNLIGFFFWYTGLATGGIARVSQVQYLQPFVTAMFSVQLLGETINFTTIGFMVAVVLVIALGRKMRVG